MEGQHLIMLRLWQQLKIELWELRFIWGVRPVICWLIKKSIGRSSLVWGCKLWYMRNTKRA
ncbi:hypothetical protein COV81_03635, partial [Candidatus Peregrinibacteria bacterium CG11_big_fil_rev_8_21_14_0_20_41_10]